MRLPFSALRLGRVAGIVHFVTLIAPDVLAAARGLSVAATATAFALGLALWLFGWRFHRFWTVVGVTVAAGIYGLTVGQPFGGQAIAIGLLLAVAAGLLALELARFFAFLAGGTAIWLAATSLVPNAQAQGICFLAGGLAGLLFYRLWTMALTSFLGTLVAGHAAMLLGESLATFDSVDFATHNQLPLAAGVALCTLLGLALQGMQARWSRAHEEFDRDTEKRWRRWRRRRRRVVADAPADVRALRDAFAKPE